MLRKKKIKKRDVSRNSTSKRLTNKSFQSRNAGAGDNTGNASGRVRQQTVNLPVHEVSQFLQQYLPDLQRQLSNKNSRLRV